MAQTVYEREVIEGFAPAGVRRRNANPFAEFADQLLIYPLAEPLNIGGVDQEL